MVFLKKNNAAIEAICGGTKKKQNKIRIVPLIRLLGQKVNKRDLALGMCTTKCSKRAFVQSLWCLQSTVSSLQSQYQQTEAV